MAGLSSITIVGNITRDPELRSAGGSPVCSFSVAVNKRKKVKDEWVDVPSFFNVQVWGKRAEWVTNYLHKGDTVAVSGSHTQERYERDGQKVERWVLEADTVEPVGPLKKREEAQPQRSMAAASSQFDDDTPF